MEVKEKRYRFLTEPDENGKPQHLHQLWKDSEWQNLTGTSSVGKIFGDPNPLMWYASGKAVEQFGWLNPKKNTAEEVEKAMEAGFRKVIGLNKEGYAKLLTEAYKAHSTHKNKKAKEGTNLHAVLERFVKSEMGKKVKALTNEEDEPIRPFIEWTDKNVKRFVASEANCFSEKHWLGGQLDAIAEMNDGKLALIDFKSAKGAYPSMFVQTALYVIQVEENGLWNAKGTYQENLEKPIEDLIIVPFGAQVVKPEIRFDLSAWREGALSALNLYRLLGIEQK